MRITSISKVARAFVTSSSTRSLRLVALRSLSTSVSDSSSNSEAIPFSVGLTRCNITFPLPTTNEKCQFTFFRAPTKIEDVVRQIKDEDAAVEQVAFYVESTKERISNSSHISAIMNNDISVLLNGKEYKLDLSLNEGVEDAERLSALKSIVAQMYSSLAVYEHIDKKENDLLSRNQAIKVQLEPLEERKWQLVNQAQRKANIFGWVGLGLMGFQLGFLGRLTWWEYSWDIVEPVTYFVTYTTAIGMYCYFLLTKEEYVFPHVMDRQSLLQFYKNARGVGFDAQKYNRLKEELSDVNNELERIRMLQRVPIEDDLSVERIVDAIKKK